MNYRHAFHAGNFADVHKHVTLLALIERLQEKDTPYVVLETHAGAGLYELRPAAGAILAAEWAGGIGRIPSEAHAPQAVQAYLDLVRAHNPGGGLGVYPGSPALAAATLRDQDRLVLCELEPTVHAALRQAMRGRKGIAIHQRDGWEALGGLLPPREAKRGLVLIDPPYEAADEFPRLAQALIASHRRWPQGILAAWYPIKDRPPIERLHRALRAAELPDLLCSELCIRPPSGATRLSGSGMLIVNAPWRLEDTLQEASAWLHGHLAETSDAPWRVERAVGAPPPADPRERRPPRRP